MERRSFLKTLAAALAAAQAPAVYGSSGRPTSPAVYGGDGRQTSPAVYGGDGRQTSPVSNTPSADLSAMLIRSINVRQESPLTFFADGTAIPDGKETAEVDVEALFDNATAPLLIDAYRAREPFDLALPVFRFIGVADQQWIVSHYSVEVSVSELVLIRFTLRPASGTLKIAPPTDEEVGNVVKVQPTTKKET